MGLAITNVAGLSATHAMKGRQASTYDIDLQAIAYLERLDIERLRVARTVRDAVIERDPAKVDAYGRQLALYETTLRASITEARALVKDDAARALVAEMSDDLPEAFRLGREAVASAPRADGKGDPERLRRPWLRAASSSTRSTARCRRR